MSNPKSKSPLALPLFEQEWVGNTFTCLGALTFFFLCMLLPLVGASGAATVHYRANFLTFLGVLLVAIVFSVLGFLSKQMRRKHDDSPFPRVSCALMGFYLLLLICLLSGWLKI